MWNDDLLLLLLCQGSIRHHGTAVCIVLPVCISSWKPVPWQEFPAVGSLFWQCHLGLRWAAALAAGWTSGKGPCASSASRCFLSHTLVMKCTPGLRNSLGAGANIRRSKFIIWYYNIPHLQNWEQAHLLTQNKTEQLAGRDTARLSFHSPLTARQDVMHPVPRAFSALPISDKRWKQRAALWPEQPPWLLCFCTPGRRAGKRGNILGVGIKLPTSPGRPAKAENTFPLPWQEGSSPKSLSCLWQGEELVPHPPDHIS